MLTTRYQIAITIITKGLERERTMKIDAIAIHNRWVAFLILIVAMLLSGCGVKSENDQTVISDDQALFESWDSLIKTTKQRVPQAKADFAKDSFGNLNETLMISFGDNDVKRTDSARNPLVGECMLNVTEVGKYGNKVTLLLRVTFVPDEKGWHFRKCEEQIISSSYDADQKLISGGMFLATKSKSTYSYLAALFDMPITKPE